MTYPIQSNVANHPTLPFPSSVTQDDLPPSSDPVNRPCGLRSALKLSSSLSPSDRDASVQSADQLKRSSSDPPSSHTDGFPGLLHPSAQSSNSTLRPTLSRARSSGELLPPGYERRVGFSTMETEEPTNGGGTGAEYSFTLQAKSSDYKPRRDSRCFLVATDGESYSIQALDWLMSSLVEHGDEVVVLQAVEPGGAAHKAVEKEEHAKTEAQEVLRHVLTKNDRQITVTVEFVIGPAIKIIQRMIEVYRPDSLVVGTRGKNLTPWQKAFSLSSTSQYLVARSPVPVIVVRPERKVRQSREARAKDPKRRSYQALLGGSPKPMLSPSTTSSEFIDINTLRREITHPL